MQKAAIAYGERLRGMHNALPILLLSDIGLFLAKQVLLSHFAEPPAPLEVQSRIPALLLESSHEREDSN